MMSALNFVERRQAVALDFRLARTYLAGKRYIDDYVYTDRKRDSKRDAYLQVEQA